MNWEDVRLLARRRHMEAAAQGDWEGSARSLLDAASLLTGVTCTPVAPGDSLLEGGQAVLDIQANAIWYSDGEDPGLALLYQAHEFAHFWLDHGHAACGDEDISDGAEGTPSLCAHGVEGYGPRERRECRANVFAREFLLPAGTLRQWFIGEGLDAAMIAKRSGLPEGLVFHQLTYAILVAGMSGTPLEPGTPEAEDPPEHPLDRWQANVAHVTQGPALVEAGPGTGKTRTLVGRITWLLDGGTDPASILALTYSNKAAEEMRTRVARVAPDAATRIWMGTFHSFGLEVLRKYGARIGLPPDARVLDATESLFLLERALPSLDLEHYQNLYEPTAHLHDLLGAISRAKDECFDPAAYRALAELMSAGANSDDGHLRAARAAEVARVYDAYQKLLEGADALDFGDLIFRTFRLLRDQSDVAAALRATHAHVLVDEYQDMNRASSAFLRELAGDGRGLWVVGDARQAIYRFRGAAPSNMANFARDFPGATIRSLGRNYRSRPAIVRTFAALAPRMRAARGAGFVPWEPDRADAEGEVSMEVASDLDEEAAGIAREIGRRRAAGTAYREQAVLCRSHSQVERVAERLAAAGVPTLYLGNLFDREEVRDLLALVALASDRGGSGLLRVGAFTEYAIPSEDVVALQRAARESGVAFPRALERAAELAPLSPAGAAGVAKLLRHLDGLFFGCNAWFLLAHYLFMRSDYLRAIAGDDTVAGRQRRLAIYQLLRFAYESRKGPKPAPGDPARDPKRAFLDRVRRMERFGQEKPMRQVPDGADGVDAVRLMTVHASKGLEFSAVYLPYLGKKYFPLARQLQRCPPPDGMVPTSADGDHDEEEECLFFVALSRARDVLCLSRAARYGDQNSNASDLLEHLRGALPHAPDGPVTWGTAGTAGSRSRRSSATGPTHPDGPAPAEKPRFPAEMLEDYLRCPRRFYYDRILGVRGCYTGSGYRKFHGCVSAVLEWMRGERVSGAAVDASGAQRRLLEAWEERGPKDDPLAATYLRYAEAMVVRFAALVAARPQLDPLTEREVSRLGGTVTFTPDDVEQLPDGTEVLRRIRTGRVSADEKDQPRYALYARGLAPGHGHPARRQIEALPLATGSSEVVERTDRVIEARLARYDEAIEGVLAQAYPAAPASSRDCCGCAHYFTCPAG